MGTHVPLDHQKIKMVDFMRVLELVELLNKFPKELEVKVNDDGVLVEPKPVFSNVLRMVLL